MICICNLHRSAQLFEENPWHLVGWTGCGKNSEKREIATGAWMPSPAAWPCALRRCFSSLIWKMVANMAIHHPPNTEIASRYTPLHPIIVIPCYTSTIHQY